MSLSLKDQHVCSLYVSGAIFLDEAPELVGVVSFCVCMRYVEVVHQRAFMLFFESRQKDKLCYKCAFIFGFVC